jgi:pimeloyl-ACP methyl ester carboxylesterase
MAQVFARKRARVGDVELEYEVQGSGDPVVLIHGSHLADELLSLPQLGVQAAHVVGHSYGGAIALQLALDNPALVHTLCLLEPPVLMVPSAATFFEQMAPVFERYQHGDTAAAIEPFLQGVGRPNAREIVDRAAPGGAGASLRGA